MSIKVSLIKNTFFNLGGYFYLLLASFFSISILLHNLGRDVFGVYILLVSFISMSAVFDFGVSSAVVRKLALPYTSQEEKVKTWKTSFAIFLFIAIVLFFATIFILSYLSRTMTIFSHINQSTINWAIISLATIVFVNQINSHFLSLPQSNQRFDIFNIKTLLVGSANTLISAVVSGFNPNIAFLLFVQLIFHLLTLLLMLFYSLKSFTYKDLVPNYDPQTGKELFSFGIRNFVGTLAGQIESQFSNFMLGALVSAQAITAFNIPQSIVTKGSGIVSQFAQAFFPLSASLLEKGRIKKLRSLVLGIELLTLCGGILAVILSFTVGQQFLIWWLKDKIVVETAFPVLKTLSFYFLLVSLTPVPTALLQGLDKPQVSSFFAVLTVALEIIFAFYFIPIYGSLGAAYSFLSSVIITIPPFLFFAYYFFTKKINDYE